MNLRQVDGLVENDALWIISDETNKSDNLLVTVSSSSGPRTKLITPLGIFDVKSKDFVQAPRERVKARIVLTNSMLPTISEGDIVLLANPERLKPEIGSVVSYTAKRYDGSPVGVFTHRIIGGDVNEGYIVKGDSNPSPDNQRPTENDINGVVFFVIPFLGKLLSIKSLIFIIPGVLGVWMILDAIRDED